MPSRGVPFHPDHKVAMQKALTRIRTYQGSKPVFNEPTRLLVQGIVIDALVAAPQPVTAGWVHTSLMTVGGLVRWAQTVGEPLTREHLLSDRTRGRFLQFGTEGLLATSKRNYRCRLDLIATALLGGAVVLPTVSAPLRHGEATDPHTPAEVATLWTWAGGLRPATRRDRVQAVLTLALGCGLRAQELSRVTPESVTADQHGVHVNVQGDRGSRLVTCDHAWEQRLLNLVAITRPGHTLAAPWRDTPATARAIQNSLATTQHTNPPLVWFSIRSLRNTWLVRHLSQGTPIPVLLDAAGVESIEALKAFLVYVPSPTTPIRAALLRGPSPAPTNALTEDGDS